MIPASRLSNTQEGHASSSQPGWRQQYRNAFTDPVALLHELKLPQLAKKVARNPPKHFGLRVPHAFVARMNIGQVDDPLLRQVLPLNDEMDITEGYMLDPVGDQQAVVAQGVLHKYQGRALFITTGSCAVHCRYCFRRNFPYGEETAAKQQFSSAIQAVRADESIHEVLLSGGDPLSLSTQKLRQLGEALADISHIKRLRIHTRLPVVLPDRVTNDLLDWLRTYPKPVVVVVHINHAQELDDALVQRMKTLKQTGVWLLNQAVLLRGVNDRLADQVALSERLFEANIQPYYLHQLDRVQGAAHFAVSDAEAIALHQNMSNALPGYLVPKLVYEQAEQPRKMSLFDARD